MNKRILTTIYVMAGLVLALFTTCHPMIISHFNMIPGDIGDSRFIVAILNHWYNVFLGKEAFFKLNFFYPDRLALGFSEAFFGFGVIYSFFRMLGCNYFTSFELLYFFVISIGYCFILLILRKILRLNWFFSIVGAIFFVSLNAIQNQFGHAQLLGFYFYPLLVCLIYLYVHAKNTGSEALSWLYIILFSILTGLFFFTSYYTAWFFVFTIVLVAFSYIILHFFNQSAKTVLSRWYLFGKSNYLQIGVGLLVFIISLTPFLITYLPVIASGYHFPFSSTLYYSPGIKDIINVGGNNYLWSPILRMIHFDFGKTMEISSGFTFIFLVMFLGFVIGFFKRRNKENSTKDLIVYSLAAASIIIILLTTKFHDRFSLWYVIYHIIPGATAIRALGRYMIVSQMLASIFILYHLNKLYENMRSSSKISHQYVVASLLIFVITAGVCAEQVNKGYFVLNKNAQIDFLNKFNPDSQCKLFYINGPGPFSNNPIMSQIDALMVSMKLNMPTINGYSGNLPNGWHLSDSSSPLYNHYVNQWVMSRGLEKNICSLNLNTARFKKVNINELQGNQFNGFISVFNKINSAIHMYLKNGYPLSNLYPTSLENAGLLDHDFGGYPKNAPNNNWTPSGYWIGHWNEGYAIGYAPVATDVAQYLYDRYHNEATTIFFPYPKVFDPEKTKSDESGQVLIVFKKDIPLNNEKTTDKIEFAQEASLYVDFADNNYPVFLSNVSGMSHQEAWGRWTDADLAPGAKFVFKNPLPGKFTLELKAHAFGPNIGRPVKVIAGGIEKTFSPESKTGDEIFQLDFNGVKGNIIEIIPPKPTSPKDAGVNQDPRKIGVGLVYMKVLPSVSQGSTAQEQSGLSKSNSQNHSFPMNISFGEDSYPDFLSNVSVGVRVKNGVNGDR